ncbi:MAG: hypothetical protein K0S36_1164 [Nitrosospira multiformis]|nr:hypothetical protein [Nitrosospira multiformis]
MPMVRGQEKPLSLGYPNRHLYTDDTSYPSRLRRSNQQATNSRMTTANTLAT